MPPTASFELITALFPVGHESFQQVIEDIVPDSPPSICWKSYCLHNPPRNELLYRRDNSWQLLLSFRTLFLGQFFSKCKMVQVCCKFEDWSLIFSKPRVSMTFVASQKQACPLQGICQRNKPFNRLLSLESYWKIRGTEGVKLNLCTCQSYWHLRVAGEC